MKLIQEIVDTHQQYTEIRRDIHRHPELAYEENRTSEIVADQLSSYGIEVHRGLGKTGVVGILSSGTSGRAIALRADMDALAMQELNGFEHKSVHEGKMHGCGHDGHTTMLLCAARYLAESCKFNGIVYFVFQPAEEGAGGADAMIKDGLFEKFPVESVWGMHNIPTVPVGTFITRAGPFLASSDDVEVTVNGIGGHSALPHFARNPINAACAMIQAFSDFIALEVDTQNPASFSIANIHGGDAINVIPDTVRFSGTVRAFSDDIRDQFEGGLTRIADGIAASRGMEVELKYTRNYPPVINSAQETNVAARAAATLVGKKHVNADAQRVMGSEDFSFMLLVKPGNYIMIGNGEGEFGGCMIHNPHYDFNDVIIPIGSSYWVELVRQILPVADR